MVRYDNIDHDSECQTPFHEPFIYEHQRVMNNVLKSISPVNSPKIDPFWTSFHEIATSDQLS